MAGNFPKLMTRVKQINPRILTDHKQNKYEEKDTKECNSLAVIANNH